MSTVSELIAHRATAGARYVAAVTELRAAFGDLAAIERLLSGPGKTPTPSFGGPQPDPIPLRHQFFAPGGAGTANNAAVSGSFEDDIRAAFATRSAAFGIPD